MRANIRLNYPLAIAQLAVREGVSADDAWKAYLAVRLHAPRDVFDELYGQAAAAAANVARSMDLPVDHYPTGDEITSWTTRTSTGFGQRVQVLQQGPDGEIFSTPYLLRTDEPVSIREAINAATTSYQLNADRYGVQVIGGIYTGTFAMEPQQ